MSQENSESGNLGQTQESFRDSETSPIDGERPKFDVAFTFKKLNDQEILISISEVFEEYMPGVIMTRLVNALSALSEFTKYRLFYAKPNKTKKG